MQSDAFGMSCSVVCIWQLIIRIVLALTMLTVFFFLLSVGFFLNSLRLQRVLHEVRRRRSEAFKLAPRTRSPRTADRLTFL